MLFLLITSDIFRVGVWKEGDNLQDERLKELANSLPALVLRGKAPSTVKKYSGAFLRWKKWASDKLEIQVFPAKPFHVALYMSYLINKSKTSGPVVEAVSALSWVHQLSTVVDPTEHPLVRQVLAASKRILAHQTHKKEPFTPDILAKLVDTFAGPSASLSDIRTIAFCLLGYAGFFRFDELAKMKECDVWIYADHMELFIESSKTDQYRDGAWVVVARTNTKCCPVAMLERYMCMAASARSDECLFRGILHTRNGSKLRVSGGLSYTRVRELVLEKLEAIGLDKHQFGVHSLRSGGASAAAQAGVPDRLFKRHGRWRSENAKDGYVKDKLQDRLLVSRSLGL